MSEVYKYATTAVFSWASRFNRRRTPQGRGGRLIILKLRRSCGGQSLNQGGRSSRPGAPQRATKTSLPDRDLLQNTAALPDGSCGLLDLRHDYKRGRC